MLDAIPQPRRQNPYHEFLNRFDLSERVHRSLGIKQNELSNNLISLLSSGAKRETDLSSLSNIQRHLPAGGTCLAVGDGCSIPFNPPHYGSPWLSAFLTKQFEETRIISSDLVDDSPRFLFVSRGDELVSYGGLFLDCLNSRFFIKGPTGIADDSLQDDDRFLRLMRVIGDSEGWSRRSDAPFIISQNKPRARAVLLNAIDYKGPTDNLQIRIISGKDTGWEREVFGVECRPNVDIFKLQEFPELSKVSYLLARHLTPEVVEKIVADFLPELKKVLPTKCFVDISTEGLRQGKEGTFRFGVFGFPDSLETFSQKLV